MAQPYYPPIVPQVQVPLPTLVNPPQYPYYQQPQLAQQQAQLAQQQQAQQAQLAQQQAQQQQVPPHLVPQQIPPHLLTQQPQQPPSLIPQRGQSQTWTPPPTLPQAPQVPQTPVLPSQVQADQQAQRQFQVQAVLDQQAQLVPQQQPQQPQPQQPQPQQPTQMVVTTSMLSVGKEINALLRSVQRCEIGAHTQQPVELAHGIVQPAELQQTVQKLLTQAAQSIKTLDELVAQGNAQWPIDVRERLVRFLVEQPDNLPQHF